MRIAPPEDRFQRHELSEPATPCSPGWWWALYLTALASSATARLATGWWGSRDLGLSGPASPAHQPFKHTHAARVHGTPNRRLLLKKKNLTGDCPRPGESPLDARTGEMPQETAVSHVQVPLNEFYGVLEQKSRTPRRAQNRATYLSCIACRCVSELAWPVCSYTCAVQTAVMHATSRLQYTDLTQ